jgi:ribose 5-phosphate isomerase B
MRIAVGSDHAGFELKSALAKRMVDAGHQVIDLGTDSPDVSVDYPLFGFAVGTAVAEGRAERGICVCGTGIGISISANKVVGVRAALVHDVTTAALARRHNDANVVCLGGRTTGVLEAIDAVDAFFSTEFEGGRHQRRLGEISRFETEGHLDIDAGVTTEAVAEPAAGAAVAGTATTEPAVGAGVAGTATTEPATTTERQ